ncbi:MAG TPA: hypothetical protein VF905_07720 [Nitrospirota bacterium]
MHFQANTSRHAWKEPNGAWANFQPKGKIKVVGRSGFERNPEAWDSDDPMLSARLFVGFNVGNEPRWSIDDLAPIVARERKAQHHPVDASFLVQKGLYTSQRDGSVVYEDGAQVVLLNLTGEPERTFTREMVKLAEVIARDLEQELVVVQIQKGGVDKKTFGVVP